MNHAEPSRKDIGKLDREIQRVAKEEWAKHPNNPNRRQPRAAALARQTRRMINHVAWQMLRARRITAAQYQTRIERANATTDAPYHLSETRSRDLL